MNTRIVDQRTLWAVVAMETAVALPMISLPTQGDRLPGLLGPLLLVMLLPLGYLAVYLIVDLRDPSWRLLAGIGLALLTRVIVSYVPGPSPDGVMAWFARSIVPAAIGIGLWWRGGALCVAELTPGEVRTEFSVLAVCMLLVLALVRPFLLLDPTLLGASVGLFTVAGLGAAALSRQDAAVLAPLRLARALAGTSAVLPPAAAVLLVGMLRPELLSVTWLTLARLIELALLPIGWLLAWIGSLFPRGPAGTLSPPPPRPTPDALPNPAALAAAEEQFAWLGWLILFSLLAAAALAAVLATRLLLRNFIGSPIRSARGQPADVLIERSGTPRGDARDLFAWLMRWLRTRLLVRPRRRASVAHARADAATVDAWAAYQRLLSWAEQQGLARRPAETLGELQRRLSRYAPDATEAVELLTRTYEWERYGAIKPPRDRLGRLARAAASLPDRGRPTSD